MGRSTVRIDDELLAELRQRAQREKVSLTRTLNETVRAGLKAARGPAPRKHREKTFRLGTPRVDLEKALALSARLEDEETLRKVRLRK
jgi:hypothetical protein